MQSDLVNELLLWRWKPPGIKCKWKNSTFVLSNWKASLCLSDPVPVQALLCLSSLMLLGEHGALEQSCSAQLGPPDRNTEGVLSDLIL